jgi:hypothetical protein
MPPPRGPSARSDPRLVLLGIRNAWDSIVYIATGQE